MPVISGEKRENVDNLKKQSPESQAGLVFQGIFGARDWIPSILGFNIL